MTKDLTEGNPLKLILGFSLPVLAGYLFQQFYNLVDTIIVGKFLGVEALAAVGSTGSVNFLIIGFVMGVCSGFAIPVAQKFGAKDYRVMRQVVASSEILSAVFAVIMTVVTVIFCRPLLVLMQTPADILDRADSYIRIIFWGIPMTFLYNMVSGIIRSVGDSRTPVIFLVMSSIINIVLDLLFVVTFKLDVAGAAYATVISQGVSGFACLIYMKKKFEILRLTADDRKIRPQHFSTLCGVGVPMGLQYSITAIGSVILQSSVNTLGSEAVASVTAGGKIGMLFCTPFDALGTTMATYGGQNVGACKYDHLKSGLRVSVLIGLIYSLCAFVIMYFFGSSLSLLFLDSDELDIIRDARTFLLCNSAFYFPLSLVNIVRFLLQGMGFRRFAVFSGIFEMVARTLVGLFAVPAWGYIAACLASPFAWILADCFLIPAFYHCYHRLTNWQPHRPLKQN